MHSNIHHTINATEQTARRDGHILWYIHFRKLFALLFLMLASMGAWATDYVFKYGDKYLGVNANGTLTNYTTFNPTYCVWTCDGDLGTTSQSLYVTRGNNNTKYYLFTNQTAGNEVGVQTSAWANWRLDNGYLAYHWTSGWFGATNNYAYLYYRGSSWRTSSQNNRNNNNAYSYGTDYRATSTASSPSSAVDNTTLPTISCSGLSGSTGLKMTHTNLGGTYISAATTITIGGTPYYKGSNGVYSATAPTVTFNPTYRWSIVQGGTYATIDETTGVLTLRGNPTTNQTIRVQLATTNIAPLADQTATYDLTLTAASANNNLGTPTVSCTGLSGSAGLQLTHTNISGKYVPQHSTFTVGGTTYYYYNGQIYNNTDAFATTVAEGDVSYAWSVTSGGAVITNAGVLTLTSDANQTITVRCSATASPNITKDATYTLTATATAALNEATYGEMAITPASTTLDLGGTSTYTASASISKLTRTRPQYVTITDQQSHTHYKVGTTYQASVPAITETPGSANFTQIGWSFSGGAGNYYNPSTYSSQSTNELVLTRTATVTGTQQTFTITATGRYDGWEGPEKTATATVTIPLTQVDITNLYPGEALSLGMGGVGSVVGHYSWQPNDPSAGQTYTNFKYTSNSTSIATVDASGNVTAVSPGSTTITVTAVKLDGTDGVTCNVTVNVAIDAPTISIDGSGNVTITHSVPGVQIRYTTDGSNPTASTGTEYTDSFRATNQQTIKAIAVANGVASTVASEFYVTSGISGGKVILNDLQDHNWTLYQSTINGEDNPIYYPDPRNIKITYQGNGAAVAWNAPETEFVYYKTLTKENNRYPYTSIPNPFSKRPTVGTGNTRWRGFSHWEVVSVDGGTIQNAGGTTIAVGGTINAETDVYFVPTRAYSVNSQSMEVVLKAIWVQASVVTSVTTTGLSSTGTYETNFVVLTSGTKNSVNEFGRNATISALYPNGTTDGTNSPANNWSPALGVLGTFACSNDLKLEYIRMSGTGTINANNKYLILGRGIIGDGTGGRCAEYIKGYNANTVTNLSSKFRLESGIYDNLSLTRGYEGNNERLQVSGTLAIKAVLGCDYDRSTANNSLLKIRNNLFFGYYNNDNNTSCAAANKTNLTMDVVSKSGDFNSSDENNIADAGESFYMSWGGRQVNIGKRHLIIEGGRFLSIAGGIDQNNNANDETLYIRMYGGRLRGSMYGAAAFASTSGHRKFVITGGQIDGWIAGGCNGTQDGNDETYGVLPSKTYIYVGGNAKVGSNTTVTINDVQGGNVFAAGRGRTSPTNSGRVLESYLVIADNSRIKNNAYGGGNLGFALNGSHIYVTGGEVAGRVFGGANLKGGGAASITMTGGKIFGGLYGGSNESGAISGDVTIDIIGGQVGRDGTPANVHGGGYGNRTLVNGNVNITLGNLDAPRDADGVLVYGDVYGGSALGQTNATGTIGSTALSSVAYKTGKVTNVTMNAGYIHGSLYGGALGSNTVAANVYGPVQVKVYGGSVFNTDGSGANGSGAVYGANNINGAPQRSVTVDIYGTNSAPAEGEYALFSVYGGGNAADYRYTDYPTVTVHNCDNSIEYVYGGGNAAAVNDTRVTIYGGNKIGNVFGGGNGISGTDADVYGNTNVDIFGGTIGDVYGGSNSKGTISGSINVNVNAQAEPSKTACPINIDNVYGGGNKAASAAGNITIGCAEHIGAVYGGANQANVTGDIALNIVSGHIDNVFGGNNNSGNISGNITVNVNDNGSACGMAVGNVYGGGNLATYGAAETPRGPVVNIKNGTISGNVYGGGKGDPADHTKGQIIGVPVVNIGDNTEAAWVAHVVGDVYGGGDAGNVVGTPQVNIINKCNTQIDHDVYGGGNAADVSGTDVNIDGGTITGMVFGGGHGDKNSEPQKAANVNGNVKVDITGGSIDKVFGGSNSKGDITGTINLNINKEDGHCDMHITEVYGGGNEAAGNAGTITIGCTGDFENNGEGIGDVYGGANAANINNAIDLTIKGGHINRAFGGNNASGNITGSITVNVDWDDELTCGKYLGDVFGGGNLANYSNATTVNMKKGTVNHIYGGGNEAGVGSATINMQGGDVLQGLYGGCNTSGTVSGDIAVNISNGTVGTNATNTANVHGGGYGAATATEGNVTVTIAQASEKTVNIWGDVYGGSALGNVNNEATDLTKVQLDNGTVHGNIYGGGLGSKNGLNGATEDVAAVVNGEVQVIVNGGTVTEKIFGCNNVNGTPKADVTVTINGTDTPSTPGSYALSEVYGGGNMADYAPTKNGAACKVVVNGCDNSIGYIYGGGNAADVTSTDVEINGGQIGTVFGGGHGDKDANPATEANVSGNVNVKIYGGTINQVFAGSNSKGTIDGTATLTVNKQGSCEMHITEVYGGGNQAEGNAGTIEIGCTGGEGEGISDVYGGAREANVTSPITLNITGGNINNVFGGNNASGSISGGIEVNVDWDGNCSQNSLGNVYGGGNLAQYTIPNEKALAVNIKNGTVTNNVYGGGKGDANDHTKGQVTGNPVVTIGVADNDKQAIVSGDVYGGGDAGNVVGTPVVNVINKCNTQIANVYGGGNAADVSGTDVNIDGGVITGMVFGGGHGNKDANPQKEANVDGDVIVDITGGTINKVFGGSNSKGDITGMISLNIDKGDNSCDMHITEVYGGGNEAAGNAGTISIGCTGGNSEGIGDVYGGANAADINSNITLNITGGKINNVFGGNNNSGSIDGTITVNVDWAGSCGKNYLGYVYGGGNKAAYCAPEGKTDYPKVYVRNATVEYSVFGGGLGKTAVVTGNPQVTIGIGDGSDVDHTSTLSNHRVTIEKNVFGGGSAANVVGSTRVNVNAGEFTSPTTHVQINGHVFGGGEAALVQDSTNVLVKGSTVDGYVYGGGNAGPVGTSSSTKTYTKVIVDNSEVKKDVFGGGLGAPVYGNTAVWIKGENCFIHGSVLGGGFGGDVTGDTHVQIGGDTDKYKKCHLTGGTADCND